MNNIVYCNTCSINSIHPGIDFKDGYCSFCRVEFPKKLVNNLLKAEAMAEEYENASPNKHGEYDCMLCLSGGKERRKAINMGGSPNIPNLRTFSEFLHTLRDNKIMLQIQKLSQFA